MIFIFIFLVVDFFKKLWNVCLKMHNLHFDNFYSVPSLAWINALKNEEIKLDNIISFMIELGNRKCNFPLYS